MLLWDEVLHIIHKIAKRWGWASHFRMYSRLLLLTLQPELFSPVHKSLWIFMSDMMREERVVAWREAIRLRDLLCQALPPEKHHPLGHHAGSSEKKDPWLSSRANFCERGFSNENRIMDG